MSASYATGRRPGAVMPIAELWKLLNVSIDDGLPVPAAVRFGGRGLPGAAHADWPAICVLQFVDIDALQLWADALGASVDEREHVDPGHGTAYAAVRAHLILEGWRVTLVAADSTADADDELAELAEHDAIAATA